MGFCVGSAVCYQHVSSRALIVVQPNKHTHRPSELYFPEFVEFVARCGLILGERYPYNEQFPTVKAKIMAVFKLLLLHDAARLSRKLSTLMLNTRAPPEKVQQIVQAAAAEEAVPDGSEQYGYSM